MLILFIFGLILGSFVNAFVWRHYSRAELIEAKDELLAKKGKKKKELLEIEDRLKALSVTKGRSMCTHCGHQLAARDLVPVISFLWLKGRCRYCGEKIDDTPVAEVLTAILFAVSYVFWPQTVSGIEWLNFTIWLVFLVGFAALVIYDLRWYLLPHSIVLPLIGLAALYVLVQAFVLDAGPERLVAAFWGALLIGGIFYVLFRVSDEKWIGGGDITLGTLLGLLVGGPAAAFLLIFIASLLGTLVSIPLLVTGRASRSSHLPFGPYLIIAGVIVTLFGQRIIDWYLGALII